MCVKFHQNISNSFQLIEQTLVDGRNGYFQYLQCLKGCNSKSRVTRVMVLIFCTSSHSALHLWESSWKYLKRFSTYWADMNTWWKWLCAMFKVSDRLQTVLWCSAFIWSVAVQSKSLVSKLKYDVFCTSPCQQVIGIFEFCFGKLIWIPAKYIFMEKYFIYMQIQCIPLTWSYVLKVKQKTNRVQNLVFFFWVSTWFNMPLNLIKN